MEYSGRASTSWPCVIRHDPSRELPKLKIVPSHFQPYLDALRRDYPLNEDPQKLEGEEENLKKDLKVFMEESFQLPEEVEGFTRVKEMVSKATFYTECH
jgi:hypothetical protein